ncbi:7668_t:CDS:2, partial [Gigaspora rosea]
DVDSNCMAWVCNNVVDMWSKVIVYHKCSSCFGTLCTGPKILVKAQDI